MSNRRRARPGRGLLLAAAVEGVLVLSLLVAALVTADGGSRRAAAGAARRVGAAFLAEAFAVEAQDGRRSERPGPGAVPLASLGSLATDLARLGPGVAVPDVTVRVDDACQDGPAVAAEVGWDEGGRLRVWRTLYPRPAAGPGGGRIGPARGGRSRGSHVRRRPARPGL